MRLRNIGERPRVTLSVALGEALERTRKATGVSRCAFARKVGVDVKTLLDLELGRANPTLDTVERIAEVYGLEVRLGFRPAQEDQS